MKMHRPLWVWSVAAATCGSAFAAVTPTHDYGKLPLTFEANAGQTDSRVKYISRGAGYTLFLTAENEAVVSLARVNSKGDGKPSRCVCHYKGPSKPPFKL